jgi:hypothetical protein
MEITDVTINNFKKDYLNTHFEVVSLFLLWDLASSAGRGKKRLITIRNIPEIKIEVFTVHHLSVNMF